ncbi:MAG: ATP-dependent DNA ligase, partial [Candidatus Woesearchaeota archaeon]
MEYEDLAKIYEKLESTSKGLEKTSIIADFLKKCLESELKEVIYLLQGRVFPAWDERKIGMSSKLMERVIAKSSGNSVDTVVRLLRKEGDLGIVAQQLMEKKVQRTLGFTYITVNKVVENIRKLASMEGEGTVDRKIAIVSELLTSAKPLEAKYIVRTVVEEMRAGVAEGKIRDALVWAFLPNVIGINASEEESKGAKQLLKLKDLDKFKGKVITADKKLAREIYKELVKRVENAYHIETDYGEIGLMLKQRGLKGLKDSSLEPGKPLKVMLYPKAKDVPEAFKGLGKPAIAEKKIDGFRMQVHCSKGKISLFTRRLENVTKQFPDVVEAVKNVHASSFILDSEVVGLDMKTKKMVPFQQISQRIKRKHDIARMAKELPVKIIFFDAMYVNGDILLDQPFSERRKRLEAVIRPLKDKVEIIGQLKTGDEDKVNDFYDTALSEGYEGIMLKAVNGLYQPGRRVGYGFKLKPVMENLDLVIVGAELGEGKRAKWLASFTLACRRGNEFLEIGKVGTGIKEKGTSSVTFAELTRLLKPLMGKNGIEPKIIVEVAYE